jgi:cytochrome c oxidase subunit 2
LVRYRIADDRFFWTLLNGALFMRKRIPGPLRMAKGFVSCCLVFLATAGAATARDGQPEPWQMGLQNAVTPIAEQMNSFHNYLLVIITAIAVFVLCLLIYVMVRFNERSNPKPSRTTHHTILEVVWTVVPVLILFAIAIPSFRLLFAQYDFPKADLTIKAIGNQWSWTYEYPDHDGLRFDSYMVADKDLKPGQTRLLAVDNEVVVPVGKTVHVLVTASDVLHNWAIPAFGVKTDAVPGRIVKTWFRTDKKGVYYGQCSELCGQRHAFMPIAVRVVSEEDFAAWIDDAKKKFASTISPPVEERNNDAVVKFAAAQQ